jgi:hypothetical protein
VISVNNKALAAVLGLKSWPEDFHNDHQRMAARVITDFVGGKTPDVAISNATHWIDAAYTAGQAAGIALERRAWQEKIAKMFDVPVPR